MDLPMSTPPGPVDPKTTRPRIRTVRITMPEHALTTLRSEEHSHLVCNLVHCYLIWSGLTKGVDPPCAADLTPLGLTMIPMRIKVLRQLLFYQKTQNKYDRNVNEGLKNLTTGFKTLWLTTILVLFRLTKIHQDMLLFLKSIFLAQFVFYSVVLKSIVSFVTHLLFGLDGPGRRRGNFNNAICGCTSQNFKSKFRDWSKIELKRVELG